tara:strand:+ start:70 stop:477 length:408 start_codon:yes stop_codon:yes gene_type:complete
MVDEQKNLSFSLREEIVSTIKNELTYEELLKDVDSMDVYSDASDDFIYNEDMYGDECFAVELNYDTNYTKKQLERIVGYYEISKRKKNKQQLIDSIVIFESDDNNLAKVLLRKKLWLYVKEIKADKYLSKFLILD